MSYDSQAVVVNLTAKKCSSRHCTWKEHEGKIFTAHICDSKAFGAPQYRLEANDRFVGGVICCECCLEPTNNNILDWPETS